MNEDQLQPLGEALITAEGLWFRQQYFSTGDAIRQQWFAPSHPMHGKRIAVFMQTDGQTLWIKHGQEALLRIFPLQPVYARLLSLSELVSYEESRKVTFLWKKRSSWRPVSRK